VCLPGSTSGAGSTGAVYPGALTVFKQPIVIPEGSWVRDQKVRFNVRNFLTSVNADPGPVKAVILLAKVGSYSGGGSLSSSSPVVGPSFFASQGDLDYSILPSSYSYVLGMYDLSFRLNSTQWQTSCYPSGSTSTCQSSLSGDVNTALIPLNASSEMLLGFYSGGTNNISGNGGLGAVALSIVGYYN